MHPVTLCVHSFNERLGNEQVRVYIAPLFCDQGHYGLGATVADHDTQALSVKSRLFTHRTRQFTTRAV